MGTVTSTANDTMDGAGSIVIREARASDLAAVLELLQSSALPETGVAEAFGAFLVATRDERVLGACGLERYGSDRLLRSVVVAREARHGGVGRRLIDTALTRAREQRVDAVYLLTTSARDYFARHGFQPTPREDAPAAIRSSWEFANGCPSSATFMARRP